MAKNILEGNIAKNLFHLAWPPMIAMLFHVGFNIVDMIFVGRLGPEYIAAISIVFPIIFFTFAIINGLGIGCTSLIARYIGAKKIQSARCAANHSVIIALVLGIIVTILALVFDEALYRFMQATPSVIELASSYGNYVYGFSIFMFISIILESILRGEGHMKIPMIAMVVSTIVNIVLDPLLIFGLFGFPRLEMEGAAIATVISRFIAMAILIYFFFKPYVKIKLYIHKFKISMTYIKEIFRVALPSSLNMSIMSFAMLILTKIVGYFGTLAIAAFGIGVRIESLVILPVIGVSTAVITIVGQSVGAKDFDRASKTTFYAVFYSMGIVALVAIFFWTVPTLIFSFFTKDITVINFGVDYLRIVSFVYIFAAIGINISAAFQGSGHAMPTLVLTLLRLIIIQIPAALILAFTFKMELVGVWYGMVLSAAIAGTLAILWFRIGTWKKKTYLAN